jgi:Amino acid synthesis
MEPEIRKIAVTVEEIHREGEAPLSKPQRVAAAMAVIKNPFANKYSPDITLLSKDYSEALGPRLAKLAADALGTKVKVFGKASLVGLDGEVQHGSAIIHTRLFGDALRNVAKGHGVVPGAEKRGTAGSSLDIALKSAVDGGTLNDSDPSCYYSFEVRVPDAPRDDEILIVAAVGDGPRPDPRNKS